MADSESGYEAESELSFPSSNITISDYEKKEKKKKKKPCEICGSDANDHLIMTCFMCRDTREHIYCQRILLRSVPPIWLCEECRSSSSKLNLSEESANSIINQLEETMNHNEYSFDHPAASSSSSITNQGVSNIDQTASSRGNQMEEDVVESNQVGENANSLPVVAPHDHMYTTSEENSPEEHFSETRCSTESTMSMREISSIQINDLSTDSECDNMILSDSKSED